MTERVILTEQMDNDRRGKGSIRCQIRQAIKTDGDDDRGGEIVKTEER